MFAALIAVTVSTALSAEGYDAGSAKDCDEFLVASDRNLSGLPALSKAIQRFEIRDWADHSGFSLVNPRSKKIYAPNVIWLREPREKFWRSRIWHDGNEKIRFVDVGFTNLSHESVVLNVIASHHVREFTAKPLLVRYGLKRTAAIRTLHNIRWAVHDRVLEKYEEKKKYLAIDDFGNLIKYNVDSDHSDVFALMEPTAKPIEKMSEKEIKDRLLMAIQVSYFGDRNYFLPSRRGILKVNGYHVEDMSDMLPFGYRIPTQYRPDFLAKFYAEFNPTKTCEMNRYARFGKFPDAFHDRFLFHAFMTAHARGMETIIASVDTGTSQYFQDEYGFKVFSELPTATGEPEFLLYMHVNSSEFRNTVQQLMRGSAGVKAEYESGDYPTGLSGVVDKLSRAGLL